MQEVESWTQRSSTPCPSGAGVSSLPATDTLRQSPRLQPHTARALCFLVAGLLYGAGGMGIAVTVGAHLEIGVALMLVAIGTGFLVGGILLAAPARSRGQN